MIASYVQDKRVHGAIPRLAVPQWQLQAAAASDSSCDALCWWVGQVTEPPFSSRWKGLSEALGDQEADPSGMRRHLYGKLLKMLSLESSASLTVDFCLTSLVLLRDSWSDYECMLLTSLDKFIRHFCCIIYRPSVYRLLLLMYSLWFGTILVI